MEYTIQDVNMYIETKEKYCFDIKAGDSLKYMPDIFVTKEFNPMYFEVNINVFNEQMKTSCSIKTEGNVAFKKPIEIGKDEMLFLVKSAYINSLFLLYDFVKESKGVSIPLNLPPDDDLWNSKTPLNNLK